MIERSVKWSSGKYVDSKVSTKAKQKSHDSVSSAEGRKAQLRCKRIDTKDRGPGCHLWPHYFRTSTRPMRGAKKSYSSSTLYYWCNDAIDTTLYTSQPVQNAQPSMSSPPFNKIGSDTLGTGPSRASVTWSSFSGTPRPGALPDILASTGIGEESYETNSPSAPVSSQELTVSCPVLNFQPKGYSNRM